MKSSKSNFRWLRFDQNNSGQINGPDSILDLVARRLRYTESYTSAHGLARLQNSSAQLGSSQLGSRGWRGKWVPLCWRVSWHGMLTPWLCHDDVILIRVWHVGWVIWYSGRVSPSGWRRRMARVWARGQHPRQRMTAREDDFDVLFRRRFQQWLHLFLLYIVVWSKHNFDNFYFWAKNQTPL